MKSAPDKPTRGIRIIDVCEADECELVKVDNVPLLQLGRIESCLTELSPNPQYFLSCKTGVRSVKSTNFLRLQGFKYLKNPKGGITAWYGEIDCQMPRQQSRSRTIAG